MEVLACWCLIQLKAPSCLSTASQSCAHGCWLLVLLAKWLLKRRSHLLRLYYNISSTLWAERSAYSTENLWVKKRSFGMHLKHSLLCVALCRGGMECWQWQWEMQKAIQIKNAKPPEAQPLLLPYEKTQSETWHMLCWITGENAFHQKTDYSTS